MLALAIVLYVIGAIALIIVLGYIIASIIDQEFDSGDAAFVGVVGIIGIALLTGAIFSTVDSAKEYDVKTNIYTLEESDRFILGIGKDNFGNNKYYYKLSKNPISIGNVSVSEATLIYDDTEEPYLLKHKAKWKDLDYYLYVPENVKIVQYTTA